MSSALFGKLIFLTELLVAEYMFLFRLKKRSKFPLRCVLHLAVSIGFAVFFPMMYNTLYMSFAYLCIFAVTVGMFKFCYKEPLINILFCAIAAYTLQHFAYELSNLVVTAVMRAKSPLLGIYADKVVNWSSLSKETVFLFALSFACYLTSYMVGWFLFVRQIKKSQALVVGNIWLFVIVGVGLVVDIFLNSVFVYLIVDGGIATNVIIYIYNCLCCVLLLSLQFGLVRAKEAEDERDMLKTLWHQRKEQYELTKENIDLFNLKCHDMRHQIRRFGQTRSIPGETIEELEKYISLYDSTVETGNEVLDTILTEKSIKCNGNGITLTCMADGEKIAFMSDTDVYSLFGNALENAIDAVMKLDDVEKRIIGLNLYAKGGLITLNIYNAYAGIIDFENGLPKTTKSDVMYHGFGVKSIKMIVEKYSGTMEIYTEDGIFNLAALIPIPPSD